MLITRDMPLGPLAEAMGPEATLLEAMMMKNLLIIGGGHLGKDTQEIDAEEWRKAAEVAVKMANGDQIL